MILAVYLFIINAVSFTLMYADKRRAKKNLWRIPEATLMVSALLGGSLGAWYGMRTFHHKTRKPKFRYGVPLILTAHILIAVYLLYELMPQVA